MWVPGARDWRVQIEQPLVVLPQFQTRYHPTTELDPRIRPIADADYLGLLYRTIEFAALKRAQFCVFPEYSWPLSEAAKVFKLLHDQHDDGRAHLLSFEHMTVAGYESLLEDLRREKYFDDETLRQEIDEITLLNPRRIASRHHQCLLRRAADAFGILAVPQRKLRPARLEEEVRDQWRSCLAHCAILRERRRLPVLGADLLRPDQSLGRDAREAARRRLLGSV